jgi:peptide/nickel transport system substrate-binding protein
MRLLILVVVLALAGGAEAAREKVFVYHLNAAPDVLDPAKCNNQRCQRVMWPIYEPLINLSKDLSNVLPGLAESWETSADGLTYTFRLRNGVTFHDGSRFTAHAAKLNLERNYLKGSRFYTADPPNVRERLLMGLIKEIVVLNDHTLKVELRNRRVNLLFLVPMVSPGALAQYGKAIGDHPVGTGPFRFARKTADEVRLVAYSAYWGGRPKLDEIAFRVIPEFEKMTQEFLSGRIDFIPEVEPVSVERIIGNPVTKLVRVPTLSIYYLGFRMDRKPFDDIRLRYAVTKAIDVERAILFTSRGTAIPAYSPLPPGVDGYDPGSKRSNYQPDRARQLLHDAGHAGGLRVSLVVNAGWGLFAELAQAIKTDLAKIGVSVDLVPVSGWSEVVKVVRQGQGDFFLYGWLIPLPDADAWLTPMFQTKSVDNLTGYSNAAFDALLDQAREATDVPTRRELYRKAQRLIIDESPIVPLFNAVHVSAYNTRVIGLDLNAQAYPFDRFGRIELKVE